MYTNMGVYLPANHDTRESKGCVMFWFMQVCSTLYDWGSLRHQKVPNGVSDIAVFARLTRFALLLSVYDLKAVQMNLRRELMLYEFDLSHSSHKSIFSAKGKATVVGCNNQLVEEISLKLQDPLRSGLVW